MATPEMVFLGNCMPIVNQAGNTNADRKNDEHLSQEITCCNGEKAQVIHLRR